jgi:hypothetical protein
MITILPLIIAVLIMTPRLTSPQFRFLDDGYILNEVRKILGGDISMTNDLVAGRFRPFYWLYFTIIYALAGPNPFWFFIGHLIILLVVLVEIRLLLKHYQAKDWQILLTSLIFLFSVPIVENFYTLSKGETLQLIFLLASLLCLERLKKSNNTKTTLAWTVLASLSILSAIWAKETTYVMLPLVFVWGGYVIFRRDAIPKEEKRAQVLFVLSALGSLAIYLLFRHLWGTPPMTDGTYTNRYTLSPITLLTRVPRWLTLYAFYFSYLLPLTVMVVILLLSKKAKQDSLRKVIFYWGMWILAWSVGFMPWEYAESYYLLPFTVGISILTGLLAPAIAQAIKGDNKTIRWAMTLMTALYLVLFLITLTHYHTHARVQLSFDRMNDQMMMHTKQILDENGDLIIGTKRFNEYVQNLGHFLIDQYGMTGITYDFVSLETLLNIHTRSKAILLLPYIDNQPRLLLRAGVEEEFTMAWVDEIQRTLDGQLILDARFRDEFSIININLPVLACPLLGERGFCEHPDPFFDTRTFSFGWDIYRIQ